MEKRPIKALYCWSNVEGTRGNSMVVVDVEAQSNFYPEHCLQMDISLGTFSGLRHDGKSYSSFNKDK